MSASIFRWLLSIVTGAAVLLFVLWLAFPLWSVPVTRLLLPRAGLELEALEAGRPGLTGLDIETAALRRGEDRIRLREVRIAWRLAGGLDALRIEQLDVRLSAHAEDAAPADEAPRRPPTPLPSPGTLLAALPFDRVALRSISFAAPKVGLRAAGELHATPERASFEGRIESDTLAAPLHLQADLSADGLLRLRAGADPVAELLSAEFRIREQADALVVEARLRSDAALLPALLRDAPGVDGEARLRARIEGDAYSLEVLPGTALAVDRTDAATSADAPRVRVRLAPEAPWRIDWRDGALSSDGTLAFTFSAAYGIAEAPDALAAAGTLRLEHLSGRPEDLDIALAGELDGRSAALRVRADIEADARLQAPGSVTLAEGTTLRMDLLEAASAAPVLEGLELRLIEASELQFGTLAWTDVVIAARARAFSAGNRRVDLSPLALEVRSSGSADAPSLALKLNGPGLALRGGGRIAEGAALVELESVRAEAGPRSMVPTLLGSLTDGAVRLEAGTLSLTGARWPPQPGAAITLAVRGVHATAAGALAEGLTADLGFTPGPGGATLTISQGRADRFVVEDTRIDDATFSARVRLPDWTADALRAAQPPHRIVLDGLDLTAARIAAPAGSAEGLDVRLTALLGPGATSAELTRGLLRRITAGPVRIQDVDLAAEARLPAWGTKALAAGGLPEIVEFDAADVTIRRAATDLRALEGIAVRGSGRLDADGPAADLEAEASTISAAVPASALRCGMRFAAQTLRVRDCGVDVLGGHVEVPAAEVDLATRSGYVPVALLGLDLGAVLLLMQDEALTGNGILDGALPLRIESGEPVVRDGYVGARPPGGRLRYAADAALLERMNQPGLSLAMAALGDFRYSTLGSYVDYARDGTLGLRVRLAGSNPKVENGRPIDFNLDVTQNLPGLLQSLRLSQTIEEALERRLRERKAPR